MAEKIYEIIDSQLIESGVFPSVDPIKVPLWKEGENINFRRGAVEKMGGYVELADVGSDINCIQQAFVAGNERAYLGVNGGLYKYENSALMALQTGLSAGFWSMAPWGSWLLATNGVDNLRIWKNGGAPIAVASALFDTAEIVRVLKYHVVVFNTSGAGSNGPSRIAWSSADNPEDFTATEINSAGGINVRNISSPIQAAELFGEDIAFYSLDQMFLFQYIGGQLVFGYDENMSGIGAIGKNVVIPVGRRHFGLERRGFWETDGAQERFIDEPAVKDYAQKTINFSKPQEIVSFHNRRRRQVEWYFPKVGGGWAGLAYEYESGSWAPRDVKFTATQAAKVFGGPLAGASTKLVKLESGVNAGTAPLAARIQTKPLHMEKSNYFKYVDEIRLRMENTGGVSLRIGLSESASGPFEWLDPVTALEQNFVERESVFFVLEFSSTELDATWAVSAIEFFGVLGGLRV